MSSTFIPVPKASDVDDLCYDEVGIPRADCGVTKEEFEEIYREAE